MARATQTTVQPERAMETGLMQIMWCTPEQRRFAPDGECETRAVGFVG
jgi:hypothetical protein